MRCAPAGRTTQKRTKLYYNREPSAQETYPLIYQGVLKALQEYEKKTAYRSPEEGCVRCELRLMEGYCFEVNRTTPWKGAFQERKAVWEAPDIESALAVFWRVHDYIQKKCRI